MSPRRGGGESLRVVASVHSSQPLAQNVRKKRRPAAPLRLHIRVRQIDSPQGILTLDSLARDQNRPFRGDARVTSDTVMASLGKLHELLRA